MFREETAPLRAKVEEVAKVQAEQAAMEATMLNKTLRVKHIFVPVAVGGIGYLGYKLVRWAIGSRSPAVQVVAEPAMLGGMSVKK